MVSMRLANALTMTNGVAMSVRAMAWRKVLSGMLRVKRTTTFFTMLRAKPNAA